MMGGSSRAPPRRPSGIVVIGEKTEEKEMAESMYSWMKQKLLGQQKGSERGAGQDDIEAWADNNLGPQAGARPGISRVPTSASSCSEAPPPPALAGLGQALEKVLSHAATDQSLTRTGAAADPWAPHAEADSSATLRAGMRNKSVHWESSPSSIGSPILSKPGTASTPSTGGGTPSPCESSSSGSAPEEDEEGGGGRLQRRSRRRNQGVGEEQDRELLAAGIESSSGHKEGGGWRGKGRGRVLGCFGAEAESDVEEVKEWVPPGGHSPVDSEATTPRTTPRYYEGRFDPEMGLDMVPLPPPPGGATSAGTERLLPQGTSSQDARASTESKRRQGLGYQYNLSGFGALASKKLQATIAAARAAAMLEVRKLEEEEVGLTQYLEELQHSHHTKYERLGGQSKMRGGSGERAKDGEGGEVEEIEMEYPGRSVGAVERWEEAAAAKAEKWSRSWHVAVEQEAEKEMAIKMDPMTHLSHVWSTADYTFLHGLPGRVHLLAYADFGLIFVALGLAFCVLGGGIISIPGWTSTASDAASMIALGFIVRATLLFAHLLLLSAVPAFTLIQKSPAVDAEAPQVQPKHETDVVKVESAESKAEIDCYTAIKTATRAPQRAGDEWLNTLCFAWLDVCVAILMIYNSFMQMLGLTLPVGIWLIARGGWLEFMTLFSSNLHGRSRQWWSLAFLGWPSVLVGTLMVFNIPTSEVWYAALMVGICCLVDGFPLWISSLTYQLNLATTGTLPEYMRVAADEAMASGAFWHGVMRFVPIIGLIFVACTA